MIGGGNGGEAERLTELLSLWRFAADVTKHSLEAMLGAEGMAEFVEVLLTLVSEAIADLNEEEVDA